ncbi:MAG TPA: SRPBCC family protein [Solirubrobacteraceae bacterium]
MELTNDFVVDAPVETMWELLTDVERIAPCVPGFELKEVEGDEYRGTMKVKVGAISMSYDSAMRFVERDETNHRAVIAAEGRDARGNGSVTATITSTLAPEGGKTKASIVTDVSITGKIAQFGRGILADVSNRMVGQFVHTLEASLLRSEEATSAEPARSSSNGLSSEDDEPAPGVRSIASPPAQPVDLMATAGGPIVKRLAPVALLLAFFVVMARRRARR